DSGAYTLAESGPTGYTSSGWTCIGAATSTATSVNLVPGENATCTINNTAIRPTLTLIKTVANQAGGTAVVTDWTLSATGPPPITGLSGQPAITRAPVNAGTYTLPEANGPAGYTASPWICTGATSSTGTTVEV